MEAILEDLDRNKKHVFHDEFSPSDVAAALTNFVEALKRLRDQGAISGGPSSADGASPITADWLLAVCSKVPSELGPERLAQSVLEASHLPSEAQQQAALFDALGASEAAMEVLFDIASHLQEIRQNIKKVDLASDEQKTADALADFHLHDGGVILDPEEQRLQQLRQEALDAAQIAAITKAEAESMAPSAGSGVTHTVTRASGVQAEKTAQKAAKRAAQALKKARDAGAIVDENDLMAIQDNGIMMGNGGLMGMSQEQVWEMQESLLPEGSRKYYDQQGLPSGTTRVNEGNLERVIIPPARRDEANLHPRLKINQIMNSTEAVAFSGTTTLNPMQSTTYDVAFKTRLNMLVCAPTGAGKTNVAMLTVVSHLRDVGLIGPNYSETSDAGKKIVYIAPMKALAQEVVEKFSSKLKPLGIIVREMTGDVQLTRAAAEATNILVTTPEKWDVVTRKSGTDENSLGNKCGLLIIDEVHLLADERGAVIESIVSRFHRLVESRQRQVRIVALSATLPNYADVAEFLQVPERGLFYFGPEHRPVPLRQQFIGVVAKTRDRNLKEQKLNDICYEEVIDALKRGHQVMVFVHSRKGTGDTATALEDRASNESLLEKYFVTKGKDGALGAANKRFADRVKKSRSRELGIHFENGMGIHHAGMLRGDRKLTEQMFAEGAIRVLCCTATLAWGVNLPVHSVVIKGTEVYNPEKGGITDLSILDVQQIFGRAGRPQFDTSGEATLITTHDALQRYLDKLVRAVPIESNFIKQLPDHLNAEIVGGTVSSLKEAAAWLKYTYLYVRMLRNPLAYGINADQFADDPQLTTRCFELVKDAAKLLDYNRMIRFGADSGNLSVVTRGRVAAHFYINAESVSVFNEMLEHNTSPNDSYLARVICSADEFKNMKLRQEEFGELETLAKTTCPLEMHQAHADGENQGVVSTEVDKCFVLMQAYISRHRIKSFTLVTDMNYLASNASRVARAVFEMCIREGMASQALKLLRIAKSVDNQIWWFQTPLRHFEGELQSGIFAALETQFSGSSYDSFESTLSLLDMHPNEVGQLCRKFKEGGKIQRFVKMIPRLEITCLVQPVTSSVFQFHIELNPIFNWSPRWHGGAQSFWLWVEDSNNDKVYHYEHIVFSKRTESEPMTLDLSIPAFDPLPSQYFIRVVSDTWVGVEYLHAVSLRNIKLPSQKTPFTDLMDLTPLPTTALQEPKYEQLYSKFETFNPIQTQLFHVLYHTDCPIFLGAPTGSGKTAVSELAILRMKRIHPKAVCVYIAPLKSLARERLKEWRQKLGSAPLHWKILELSGDTHHGKKDLERADILVCTPEKWDLISRGWRGDVGSDSTSDSKTFIRRVRLLVIDEVHLLGEDRGAVLEAIVSRTRFISQHLTKGAPAEEQAKAKTGYEMTRIIGLSTALANPDDLADWMGVPTTGHGAITRRGFYNFRSSVRPVSMKVHVQGYSGQHYCPRMATMNKPCYAAIKDHAPDKPTLIFVASRRQTRLTAFDIISYAAGDENSKMFLGCSEEYIDSVAGQIRDESLRHTLTFGIGLHHAGLASSDRDIVERLFLNGDILVLVATATLAWGVNLPAHLVIVKGTEYFDGKSSRYVDYPLTDVLQMIGRAGRPGFSDEGKAVVMAMEAKKNFYKKFLYSPFPVESCLRDRLCENLNAEIAIGTVNSVVDALGYMTWTFYARRVRANPSYYGAEADDEEGIELFLLSVVKEIVDKLKGDKCKCISAEGEEDDARISATVLGLAACKYYLLCGTPKQMQIGIRQARKMIQSYSENEPPQQSGIPNALVPFRRSAKVDEIALAWLLYTLSSTHEFDELPVRHNEEILNEELSDELMWGPDTQSLMSGDRNQYHNPEIYLDPHTKCFLLLQAHLERAKLPISDYINDTKSVTENVPRLLAAMRFIAMDDAASGSLELICQFARTKQYLTTMSLPKDDPLLQLPGVSSESADRLVKSMANSKGSNEAESIRALRSMDRKTATTVLNRVLRGKNAQENALDYLYSIPTFSVAEAKVHHVIDKTTGKNRGKLKLSLEFQTEEQSRKRNARGRDDSSSTLVVVLGSLKQRMVLSEASMSVSHGTGSWTMSKELEFDWDAANADGGEGQGQMILRLVWEEIRGFDAEMFLSIK